MASHSLKQRVLDKVDPYHFHARCIIWLESILMKVISAGWHHAEQFC